VKIPHMHLDFCCFPRFERVWTFLMQDVRYLFVRRLCDNVEPRVSYQPGSLLLGGDKSIYMAVL
jgi:hypothetical protein